MTIIFVFLIYPSIVNNSFDMFNCVVIDGTSYLQKDFDLVCWQRQHVLEIIVVCLPIICIWVIGFPLGMWINLKKNKSRLSEKDFIIKYGLWYIGLTDKGYYWEIVVINSRKVFFIASAVSVSIYS